MAASENSRDSDQKAYARVSTEHGDSKGAVQNTEEKICGHSAAAQRGSSEDAEAIDQFSKEDEPMRDYVNSYNVLIHGDEDDDIEGEDENGMDMSVIEDPDVLSDDAPYGDRYSDHSAGDLESYQDIQIRTESADDEEEEDDENDDDEEEEDDDENDDDDLEDDDEDDNDDDDEEDEDDAQGVLNFMRGSTGRGSSLLRGLMSGNVGGSHRSNILEVMQRLVNDMESAPLGGQSAEFDALTANLAHHDNPYLLLESVNEISENLLVMDGMTAERVISPDKLSKALVAILKDPLLADDLELHLVTCRCLYNFIEVNQDFVNDALNNGAVETLVASLLNIVYIDLTEQCLQTLEIMSRDKNSHSILVNSDGLRACLQNLDFLTIHSQRKCLSIVANACSDVSVGNFHYIEDQFSNLTAVAESHDDALVKESAWLAIARIIESFKTSPESLEKLFSNQSLLEHMLLIIHDSCNPSNKECGLKHHSVISLLKSLTTLVATSVKISNILLDLKIGSHVRSSLSKFKKSDESNLQQSALSSHDFISIESLISCPKEILSLYLHLTAYLLPVTYSESPFLPDEFEFSETKKKINYERIEFFRSERSHDFHIFVESVWPILVGSFSATMDHSVRKQSLICFTRIVSFSSKSELAHLNLESLMGIFTSTVNNGKVIIENYSTSSNNQLESDNASKHTLLLLASTCVILENLTKKLQNNFIHLLDKEGVFKDLTIIHASLEKICLNSLGGDVKSQSKSQPHRSNVLANGFLESFGDLELLDHVRRLKIELILSRLLSLSSDVLSAHDEYKKIGHSSKDNQDVTRLVETLSRNIEIDSLSQDDWSDVWNLLRKVLTSDHCISSFELYSSGLVNKLAELFTEPEISRKCRIPANQTFIQVMYADIGSLSRLIALLQDALGRSENFEVISVGGSGISNSDINSTSLAKQIKIKLVAQDDTTSKAIPNMEHIVLSVHAIATFNAIESFLNQRLLHPDLNSESENLSYSDSNETNSYTSVFSIDGRVIPKDSTVFGAIYRSLQTGPKHSNSQQLGIWWDAHPVSYQIKPTSSETDVILEDEVYGLEGTQTDLILNLLKAFFDMNDNVARTRKIPTLPSEIFMNWKLTVKLNRQLEEPLIVASGIMPSWSINVTKRFPFIFPLQTRLFFLESTSFGHSRLIHNWQTRAIRESAGANHESVSGVTSQEHFSLGMPSRKKVRISREKILKSAFKVLQQYGSNPSILEIEYFNEVGSGLGPTLEFYATVSKEFCRSDLGIWMHYGNDSEYIFSEQGIFPAPLINTASNYADKRILSIFNVLGKFVARSLLDSRIIDFNFNELFVSSIQNPNIFSDYFTRHFDVSEQINLLHQVDSRLARSMNYLLKYLNQSSNDCEVDGVSLEDLSLYFELPGYPDIELIPNGASVPVTVEELPRYVSLVCKYFLVDGVKKQVEVFREGFSSVLPIESMSIFTARELQDIFGRGEEDWSEKAISESLRANHGYSQDSQAIKMLVRVLIDFDKIDRRAFLQFLTGSPKLPIGGFKAMHPEFTVVKKHPEPGLSADDYLPSVMTCANYLKLPDYSTEELMRSKLLHAIREGAGAFHLS